MIDTAIGSSIIVVDVFITHMLTAAAATAAAALVSVSAVGVAGTVGAEDQDVVHHT